jgi:hypothetical protein
MSGCISSELWAPTANAHRKERKVLKEFLVVSPDH